MSLDHDPIYSALIDPIKKNRVTCGFHHNIAAGGQTAAWHGRDVDGSYLPCILTGISLNFVKVDLQLANPLKHPVSITYDNAIGTAHNVLLQPLFVGVDYPVAP